MGQVNLKPLILLLPVDGIKFIKAFHILFQPKNKFMPKQNKFSAATMPANSIRYYINSVLFAHFVFQQIMGDEEPDNKYSIFAYAMSTDGIPIKEQNEVTPLPGSIPLGKKVQIGNIRLTRDGLDTLYPDKSKITDLTITPRLSAKYPGYICLGCKTEKSAIDLDGICNPSPPGRSEDEFESL